MNLSNEILFFFSALGVFNALIISLYFFFYKRPRKIANFFFGLLLLMMAIRVGKSVFFHFIEDISYNYLQLGISACLFIGPSLYFYIKSVVYPERKVAKESLFHMLPLLAGILIVGFLYPWTDFPDMWFYDILEIVYWVWMAYILATGYILKKTFKKILAKNNHINHLEFWLLSVLIGNLIVWVAYRTSNYTSYIVGALSFTFIFYLLLQLIYFSRKGVAIFNPKEKYADKKIDSDEASELNGKLDNLMQSKELFKNADLKSKEVANELGISVHQLSQFLNDNLGKSFPLFVNEYRIEAAKKLIEIDNKLTLEAIGYDCGFNSKSTFYSAFKKITGTTPAQFKERL